MTSTPPTRITVLLITYNHAEFVRKAMESVLMQEAGEPFDVLVADDGSTDDTVAIVREFAASTPGCSFRFLDSTSNHGITRNYERAFAACSSEYVAVIEGDDYWTSPAKLASQRDFLDQHRECDLCSVNYYVYEVNRSQFTPRTTVGTGHVIFGGRELIADNLVGNFSTCMYRLAALRRIPAAIYAIRSYDWAINICITRHGLIGFLREPMAVYRIHDKGAWSLLSQLEKLKTQLELIPAYDSLTDHVFRHDFDVLSDRLARAIADAQAAPASAPVEMAPVDMMSVPERRSRLLEWLPPFMVSLARHVLPPAFRQYLARVFFNR